MDFVLKSLAQLELLPGVLSLPQMSIDAGVRSHPQAHLLLLFSQLSECLGVVDPSFKQHLIKDIFHRISQSLGLDT